MRVPLFQVDAFTTQLFGGNPAAVMVLDAFLPDASLQQIAAENNLAETAFLVHEGDGYRIRWFTPGVEVPLCGHATLASAAVVMERLKPGRTSVVFQSASGPLAVNRTETGYVLDFPARPFEKVNAPQALVEALGHAPVEVHVNAFNYMCVVESAYTVRTIEPDMAGIKSMDRPGVIVTALGDSGFDFISRYFAPAKGIPEDPVTGAAHCMLAPYWGKRLGKTSMRAFQASSRGGQVLCRLVGDRVELEGSCVFYMEGTAEI